MNYALPAASERPAGQVKAPPPTAGAPEGKMARAPAAHFLGGSRHELNHPERAGASLAASFLSSSAGEEKPTQQPVSWAVSE